MKGRLYKTAVLLVLAGGPAGNGRPGDGRAVHGHDQLCGGRRSGGSPPIPGRRWTKRRRKRFHDLEQYDLTEIQIIHSQGTSGWNLSLSR